MKKEKVALIKDLIKELNSEALFLEEEFDDALIGTCQTYGRKLSVAYCAETCIRIIQKIYGINKQQAQQKFKENIGLITLDANKPIFVSYFNKSLKLKRKYIKKQNSDSLFLEEEFDDALIGTCQTYGKLPVPAYCSDKCLNILMDVYTLDEMDAYERFIGGITATPLGINKPMFISDFRKITILDDIPLNLKINEDNIY